MALSRGQTVPLHEQRTGQMRLLFINEHLEHVKMIWSCVWDKVEKVSRKAQLQPTRGTKQKSPWLVFALKLQLLFISRRRYSNLKALLLRKQYQSIKGVYRLIYPNEWIYQMLFKHDFFHLKLQNTKCNIFFVSVIFFFFALVFFIYPVAVSSIVVYYIIVTMINFL